MSPQVAIEAFSQLWQEVEQQRAFQIPFTWEHAGPVGCSAGECIHVAGKKLP